MLPLFTGRLGNYRLNGAGSINITLSLHLLVIIDTAKNYHFQVHQRYNDVHVQTHNSCTSGHLVTVVKGPDRLFGSTFVLDATFLAIASKPHDCQIIRHFDTQNLILHLDPS